MKLSKPAFHRAGRAAALLLAALMTVCAPAAAQFTPHTQVLVPQAPGTEFHGNKTAGFDASNASQGYIMARYSGSKRKVKLQITGRDKATYTYNLSTGGGYEVFPLTAGDGGYTVNIYENVTGSQYALAYGKTFKVTLDSALSPYLYPNQYCNFNASNNTVAIGEQLAKTASSELEVVSNIYNYVISHISYDDAKANQIIAGNVTSYLPSVDNALATGKGICFDYAAVLAAMLRSQGIPTRLEVGYVSGGIYHAWISTYITDIGWVNGIIRFDGQSWKLMDPTFASNGASSPEIMQFIGNGSNYTTKYRY